MGVYRHHSGNKHELKDSSSYPLADGVVPPIQVQPRGNSLVHQPPDVLLTQSVCDVEGYRDSWGQILDAKTISDEIDRMLVAERKAKRQAAEAPTMLILGSGDSGKTTFIKTLHICLGGGLTAQQKLQYHHQMLDNIVDSIKALLLASIALGYKVEPVQAKQIMLAFHRHGALGLSQQHIDYINQLWRHKGVQSCWKQSFKFKIQDTCDYFLDNIQTKAQFGYKITNQDALHVRHATTTISECVFEQNGITMRFIDVAGQRRFRKNWAAHFDNVDSTLFITSVSSYDQALEEDKTVNRMSDSIQLFSELASNIYLKNKALIVFLNKTDLLKKKLRYTKLQEYFPGYHGGNDPISVIDYFKKELGTKVRTRKDRVYMHATCCTSETAISFLVATTTDVLIKSRLDRHGLL
ncbi:hypothetical protein BDV3_003830 [Batrachochytrium dendrobatidis]|uniref:Uncharacterized protein n=1 Tax=Batrachochytrium dendrobatidis (strain JEL423) TaxID=403673 RepID=A0A177WFF9_BATDL|nr:hypothetical protein O5D80_005614 [Batrachochytrium dendrobatidis]KAK5669751.1 hypothetical protein QVD99_004135 [Batrachochytrium dendrobatidis]OAJ38280.1 hypothetical protein BDEG_22228 [Batrachochytrium dendrobatidis JEL423]